MTRSSTARITVAAVALAAAGLAVGLAPREPAVTAALANTAATYKVDPVHSSNMFRIKHNGVANFYGRFKETTGSIQWDDADAAACSLKVEIPLSGIDTGVAARDGHLKSADFFNAAQFPTLAFTSTSMKKTGEDAFSLAGDLTMHGVTKPISAELLKTGAGKDGRSGRDLIGLEAKFTVKRSDFGMDYGVSGGGLGDEVHVVVSLEAGKQ
ncbi:MAG: YceI family protein [Phycisphaerales bacterium]